MPRRRVAASSHQTNGPERGWPGGDVDTLHRGTSRKWRAYVELLDAVRFCGWLIFWTSKGKAVQ
jgi:hypothetical protein